MASDLDEPAFLDRLWPLLPTGQRLAFGMLQNVHEAQDALQDATLKCWRFRSRVREGADLQPWFLAIVANECRQRLRSRWWSVRKTHDLSSPASLPPGADEASLDLRAALARLPTDMRLVLVLRYYLDMAFDDIGRVLHCSRQAAKSRTFRALERLRTEVPQELDE
ncbi:MAG TPA: RNA polymerase sigma factor [Candidatus Dormibacteraeota bacterium]